MNGIDRREARKTFACRGPGQGGGEWGGAVCRNCGRPFADGSLFIRKSAVAMLPITLIGSPNSSVMAHKLTRR